MTRFTIEQLHTRWGESDNGLPPEVFLSTKQAASFLCVTDKFMYDLRRERRGPAYERRGAKILYTLSAVQAWREKQMIPA